MNDNVACAPAGTVIATSGILPPTTSAAIDKISQLEALLLAEPQPQIYTHHVLHAGVYSRTICIRKGDVLTSALIKIPTTLVICGKCSVLIGDAEEVLIEGYQVFAAAPGRKQAYIAHEDTFVTMSFKTNARTIEAAEEEFTNDADRLMSRIGVNDVVITGD